MATNLPDLPDGVELAWSHWGDPKSDTLQGAPATGVSPAPSWVPYTGDLSRAKKCVANGNTCNGWRISGSDLCSGHAGVMKRERPEDDE